MKFIHTSDWQIGMGFGREREKSEVLRQARLDSVKQVVALAESEKVDFVIGAGDLLDNNRLEPRIVEQLANTVSTCPVPFYLLSGNHDPLAQDSPYVLCPDLFTGSAVVFRSEEPVKINGGTLYPCPLRTRTSTEDPTRWIPSRESDDGIRIGIAHGSVGLPSVNDFPISQKCAVTKGLDFLALGHWHGVKEIDERTWYCGAPEATEFGQPNAGKVLVVEIASPAAVPKVRQVEVSRYKWHQVERHLCTEADVDQLLTDIDLKADSHTLLKVRITGTLPQRQLDRIENLKGERFFCLKWEIDVALENSNKDYRHPLLKGMATILTEKAGAGNPEAESARRALSQLRLYAKHAGFQSEEN